MLSFGLSRTATISLEIARKQSAAQVLDLSSSRQLRCGVDHGLAYEALLCLSLLAGDIPMTRFDRGAEIRRLWAGAPASSKKAFANLRTGPNQVWSELLGLVRAADPPRDVDAFTRYLRRLDAVDVKVATLGYHGPELRQVVEPEVYHSAAAGDADAIRQFARQTRSIVGGPGRARLMKVPARHLVDDIVECLRGISARFGEIDQGWSDVLERSAGEASRMAARADVKVVVERVTHGLVYNGEVGILEVLLVPSLVPAPFTIISDHDATKIFCYPTSQQAAKAESPDARLVAVYRALGDETRLRILRRLVGGSTSVGLLSDDLGLAKSTVHQHLFSLRAAGLVRLDLETGYELNQDLPDLNALLKDFLGKKRV
jgi:DNA-binding transcriptional ArsR family regulator